MHVYRWVGLPLVLGTLHVAGGDASAFTRRTVFNGAVEGTPYYRAPQFVVANDGSLLAFAEGRATLDDPGRGPGLIQIAFKRSTDMGVTWSSHQVLLQGTADYAGPAPVVDKTTGQVFLSLYRTPNEWAGGVVPTGTGPTTVNTLVIDSTNHGVSWNPEVNITTQVKDPASEVFGVSPASGIQLRWQTNPARNGRLVIPAFQSDATTARDRMMFNDSHGLSSAWQVGSLTPYSGISITEGDVVELVNGDLLLDARPNNDALPRQRFRSTDGGSTWWPAFAGDIPMTGVDSGMARFTAVRDGEDRNRIVFAAPLGAPLGAGNGRVNMGIWTSYDEGLTFINPVQIGIEADGYSNLQKLPNGHIGMMYETTALGGAQINIDRVMFVDLAATDLEGQVHQTKLTHYDGFGNVIDRKRGGAGWGGTWRGDPTVVTNGQISFSGFRFATEQGRFDLVNGASTERNLVEKIDLNTNTTSYFSLLISNVDNTPGPSNNNFSLELRDASATSQAAIGVSSAMQWLVGHLGNSEGTAPGTVERNINYFIVGKIVAMDDSSSGNFDRLYLKVFKSGVDSIPDSDSSMTWTLVGGANENSNGLIDRIAMIGGLETTWAFDELRIGTSWGAVASNMSTNPEPGSIVIAACFLGLGIFSRNRRRLEC